MYPRPAITKQLEPLATSQPNLQRALIMARFISCLLPYAYPVRLALVPPWLPIISIIS
jgi:hypothetical protein